MEALLTRYRNLTVLLIAFFAQLVLIAFQVRTGRDVPLLRVWAITAVTPVEQALEFVRRNTIGVLEDYFVLVGVRGENQRLKKEVGELKLQNNHLQSELSTADRVHALSVFQTQSPSKTLAARIIGTGTGNNSQVVFIDRGSGSEVEAGMAVITPDGIVGKVIDAYPTASLVMLVTDPSFAAGVISQKNHTRGTLKGQGQPQAIVDYVQNEQKVDPGELFFTSGDDRIFPKGFPVGKAEVVRNGKTLKQVFVSPGAFQGGFEEVLVVLEGVHQPIPEMEIASPGVKMLPAPPDAAATAGQANAGTAALYTDADRLKAQYKQAAEAQNHTFGDGNTRPPDFTKVGQPTSPTPAPPAATQPKPAGADAGAASPAPAKPQPLVAADGPAKPKPAMADGVTTPPVAKPKPGGADATAASPAPPKPKPLVAADGPAKPKPPVADRVAVPKSSNQDAPINAKPKSRGPLLVTDPADANPELSAPLNALKPKQQNQ